MISNRSIPQCTVIPELAYADVGAAIDWLCRAFGFTLRLRIADHRAQLNVGNGAVVVTDRGSRSPAGAGLAHGVLVRVDAVDAHHARAVSHGARVSGPPQDYPFGERQYTAEDPGGHRWTFSQSIADVEPEAWGGTSGEL